GSWGASAGWSFWGEHMLRTLLATTAFLSIAERAEALPAPHDACSKATDAPVGQHVFALPAPLPDTDSQVCNVEGMTLSVHNAGRLSEVYDGRSELQRDPNTPARQAAAAAREVEIVDGLVAYLRRRAVETEQAGQPFRVLIYAHGGMVFHEAA